MKLIVKLNKDILIGIFDYDLSITYNKFNIKLEYNEKKDFNDYISNIELKGKLIMKELVEKVFHPYRLLLICNKYNVDFIDLIDIYS